MIQEADRACLIMYRCENGKLSISFCDPDLRFYEGEEKDQRNADGTQKEVSVYSRRWIADGSIGKWTRVVLKGKWEEGRKTDGTGKRCVYRGKATEPFSGSTDRTDRSQNVNFKRRRKNEYTKYHYGFSRSAAA